MSQIKAVIFDMDGVLIDAKDWHYEALNRALELFGYSISRYDHLVTFDGLPTRRKLEILSKERGLPTSLHGFLNDLKQIYTLELAHARYKLAVASNSVRNSIEVMMSKSNLLPHLDFIMSNQDVTIGKPHPEIYTKTINKLGLDPTDCLVVEDNENGIKSAQDAGAHLLIVETVYDVTLENILRRIEDIEKSS